MRLLGETAESAHTPWLKKCDLHYHKRSDEPCSISWVGSPPLDVCVCVAVERQTDRCENRQNMKLVMSTALRISGRKEQKATGELRKLLMTIERKTMWVGK